MQQITKWLEEVYGTVTVQSFLERLEWVDWLAFTFLILGILYGLKKGFLRELVEIAEMVLIVYLVMGIYEKIAAVIRAQTKKIPYDSADAVAYIFSGIVIWFVVMVIDNYGKKLFHAKAIKPIHYTGGAILGFFHWLLIYSFICLGLSFMPFWPVKMVFEVGNSYIGYKIVKIAPLVYEFVSLPVQFLQNL
ncbi:MAG: CvpA family protein [Candidatus Omnitrophica bacterium]|nr:CvpA family protein [Candidatus Omnitrophota bacterium]